MFVDATPLSPWHAAHVFSSTSFSIRLAPAAVCGLWQLSHPLLSTVVYPVCAPCSAVNGRVEVRCELAAVDKEVLCSHVGHSADCAFELTRNLCVTGLRCC